MSPSDGAPRDSASKIPIIPQQLEMDLQGEGSRGDASLAAQLPNEVLPQAGRSGVVFRQWLKSMATDAEAALSAAIAYREMSSEGREQWLSFLQADAAHVNVPKIAIFAPILAVEDDIQRKQRILNILGEEAELATSPQSQTRALVARAQDGARVYVVSSPLYLDFVQVLACGVKDGIFSWVRHDPIVVRADAPQVGEELEASRLEKAPVKSVLDDLAETVLSHRRSGRDLPEALLVLSELLSTVEPETI